MLTDSEAFSGFAVDDLQAAQAFYEQTLGLKTTLIEAAGLLTLHLAGGRDTFVYEKPDFVPATYAFERYEGFEQDDKGIARGNGPDIAWFKDPAGNILSVLKQPS
jgi:catechol 2,3-dioxygenase-like lactoylglutathione lyase family enzyme